MNAIAIAAPTFSGFVGAGRQGIVEATATYYITCLAFGFRFRTVHFAVLVTTAYLLQFIFFPYALEARSYVRTADWVRNVQVGSTILMDVATHPAEYYEKDAEQDKKFATISKQHYFGDNQNDTVLRYSVVVSADAIINATVQDGTIGMQTIEPAFRAMLPRFLDPDKQLGITNQLAHRAPGLVGKGDYTTGITLGFVCDSFSSFGWIGAFVIPFLLSSFAFVVFRIIVADKLKDNVFAISLLFPWVWPFSEGAIMACIILIYGAFLTAGLPMWLTCKISYFLKKLQENYSMETRPVETTP
jgi:hypothetical protein